MSSILAATNTSLLWAIAGIILCLMELFFPTAFVAFTMGIAALLVALVSLVLPQFSLQVTLWLIFSTALMILSRQLFPPSRTHGGIQNVKEGQDPQEGETLTAICPGEAGRVLYEGNSWRAKCEDINQEIASNQKVYIVGREGNTLIILPSHLLES